MTAPPAATKRPTWASNCAASPASSDEVGSSRITSRGGVPASENAMAISTIWRSAIDRLPTGRRHVDAVAGKHLIQTGRDDGTRPRAPADAAQTRDA